MRRFRYALVAGMWLSAGVVVATSQPAGAIVPDRVGWWAKYQQLPTGEVLIPPPPTIASDQLNVSADGTPEALVISAVRYVIPEGARAKLTLKSPPDQMVVLPPGVFINACITSSGWDGGTNAVWASRPAYDCQRLSTVGARTGVCNEQLSEAGAAICDTLEFDFGPEFHLSPGVIDVALVPGGTAVPFSVNLLRPDDTSLEVYAIPETAAEDLGPPDLGAAGPGVGDFAVPDFAVSDLPGLADLGVAGGVAGAPSTPVVPFRRAAAPLRPADSGPDRLLALAILLLMSVGLLWVGRQPARAPRLLGSLGDRPS